MSPPRLLRLLPRLPRLASREVSASPLLNPPPPSMGSFSPSLYGSRDPLLPLASLFLDSNTLSFGERFLFFFFFPGEEGGEELDGTEVEITPGSP